MAHSLKIQTGIVHGHAVAYSPTTGHIATERLTHQASKLARRGHLRVSGDLLTTLDDLHVGDDLILEGVGDDVVEVGAGKVRRKIKRGIKKAAKLTVKAAKKVAKSKLGTALRAAVSVVNPAAGAGLMALSKGAKVVKRAKAGDPKKKRAVTLGKAVNDKKATKKKATRQAKAEGVSPADVSSTAQALSVVDQAQAGDPVAQQALATHEAIETAEEEPLTIDDAPEQEPSPADYSAQPDEGELPEAPADDSGPGEDESESDEGADE